MTAPLLLDLFCGAGGAGEGYRRAGFRVVGCDLDPKPLRHNPHEAYVGDALAVLDTLLEGGEWHGYRLRDFAAIHASPPCQDYSVAATFGRKRTGKYPRLITPTRERLIASGVPWVLENVIGATTEMYNPVTLCGTSLGLRVQRHRLFESSALLFAAGPCRHRPYDVSVRRKRCEYLLAYETATTAKGKQVQRPPLCPVSEARRAMGIDWMPMQELGEAIPPAMARAATPHRRGRGSRMRTLGAFVFDVLAYLLVPAGLAAGAGVMVYRTLSSMHAPFSMDAAVVTLFVVWFLAMLAIGGTIAHYEESRANGGLVLPWWRRRHRYEGRW